MIGTDTAIDQLLAEYVPQSDNALYEVIEDETNLLLYAILLELRGEGANADESDPSPTIEAHNDVEVSSTSEERIKWDFPAESVVIWNFDVPITIAFEKPGTSKRTIELAPDNSNFSISPPSGLDADRLYYRLSDDVSDESNTTFNVMAVA